VTLGLVSVTRNLLLQAYDPDILNEDRDTALCLAAKCGHVDMVKMLTKAAKCRINFKMKDSGMTALSNAAYYGHPTVVETLLQVHGIDANAANHEGHSPLFFAAMRGNRSVVRKLLLSRLVDISCKDKDGLTPLSWAIKNRLEEIAQLLLDEGKIVVTSQDMWTAVEGTLTLVGLLLNADDGDFSGTNKHGQTVLHKAVWQGNEALVRTLVRSGKIDLHVRDVTGRSALATALSLAVGENMPWAFSGKHERIVRMILDARGLNVCVEDEGLQAALQWAAQRSHDCYDSLVETVREKMGCLALQNVGRA
jgi:ankyrin repeat protein